MAESGSRRRVRLLVALVAVWVVLRIVTVAVFRKRNPLALAVVRRFNGRYLNSVMLRLAGKRHWYAARLEHVGRRSGKRYVTPVVARPVVGGFALPLPYGTDVDWLRNIQAAGARCAEGRRRSLRRPGPARGAHCGSPPSCRRCTG